MAALLPLMPLSSSLEANAEVLDSSTDSGYLDTTNSWYAVDSETGSVFWPDGVSMWDPTPSMSRLLAIDDWTACWVLKDSNWKIATFATSYLGTAKTMSIQCGTSSTHGYFHIALGDSNHQQGWRNRISSANPTVSTDSWDDLMWWAAVESWKIPLKTVDVGSGKICRPGLIKMYGPNSSGTTVLKYEFRPTFFWSITQNRLITAIPSTNPTC